MNRPELESLIRRKDSELFEPEERLVADTLGAIFQEIIFHDVHRYWQFTPCPPSQPQFIDRLCAWVGNNVSDSQIVTMLRLVPHIQFIDRDDTLALYRTAFDGQISRWIVDQTGLTFRLDAETYKASFKESLASTWFCPVTDSMDISQFHHVNKLPGHAHRPCWRTLFKFGDINKVKSYMEVNNLKRVVLLEDFVGSGTQSATALRFAVKSLAEEVPVLFVPLVLSAAGKLNLENEFSSKTSITISPVFVVPERADVRPTLTPNEPSLFQLVRELAISTFDGVKELHEFEKEAIEGPFGFGNIGTVVVMHTNCPNNTLPFVWHDGPQWRALFPRVSRS